MGQWCKSEENELLYCQNAALHHYAMQPKKVRMISELLIMVQDSIYHQPGLTFIELEVTI